MVMTYDEAHKFVKTKLWFYDEFIKVNGVDCVYTQHRSGEINMIVLPGGGRLCPKAAKDLGFIIEWPKRLRSVDELA